MIEEMLYPHAVWLDAINTAGIQRIAELAQGSERAICRTLRGLKTPEDATAVFARARELVTEHCEGLRPDDAPPGWRLVAVAGV